MARIGSVVLLLGISPPRIAQLLNHLPGVDWVAIGRSFGDRRGLLTSARVLASNYLKLDRKFSVTFEGAKERSSDLQVSVTSEILSAVRNARTDERNPKIRFVGVSEDGRGVFGVRLREGDGGVPISIDKEAFCLVSGGRHSSVMAWLAALSGFSPRLVHFRVNDKSLREVASLYSELSNRINPDHLTLQVVIGTNITDPRRVFDQWMQRTRPWPLLSGLHLECKKRGYKEAVRRAQRRILFPVLLSPEKTILEIHRNLNLKGYDEENDFIKESKSDKKVEYRVLSFGGVRADINGVLDGLTSL
jgi:hypothetical protein